MKRRDLLRLALGAPMAALALRGLAGLGGCARPALPDGELFDFGRARAHALVRGPGAKGPRTLTEVSPSTPTRRVRVAIVGAGVAGLAAAWRLRAAGVDDFVVLELGEVAGGTAQSGSSPVVAFPWGAHYVVTPFADDRVMVRLLGELGALDGVDRHGDPIPAETHAVRDPEERHFYRGRFYDGLYPTEGESPAERAERDRFVRRMNAFAAMIDARGRRAFTLPVARSSDDAALLALDQMTFGAWLTREGFTSWRLRWLCDYACRDDYGMSLDTCSAWAGLFYFCARRRPPAPDPGGGEHESNVAEDRPVITYPEGNGRIVAHLLAKTGPERVLLGHVACDVEESPREGRGAAIAADAHGGAGVRILAVAPDGAAHVVLADQVVVAAPRFVAVRIIAALRRGAATATWSKAFTTAPWAVANVHLSERPSAVGRAFAWDTVFTESASVGYVVATHQRGDDRGPTVLTWYRPLVEPDASAARQALERLTREHWAEVALSELELAHPEIRSLVTRLDVGRFGHGMVRPTPGLRAHLGAAAASIGERIHVAHTDLSGVPLCEEAMYHGVRAAEQVLRSGLASGPDVPPSWL